MKKILYVAGREFAATVLTRAFVFGVLITPLLIGGLIYLMPKLLTKAPPKMEGEVVIIDPTGHVADGLVAYLEPERFAERRQKAREEIDEATPQAVRQQVEQSPAGREALRQSQDVALGQVPHLRVIKLEVGSDLERAKAPLATVLPDKKTDPSTRLAVIVVHPDATVRAGGKDAFGTYDLYVRSKLDDRLVDDLQAGLKESIVAARLQLAGVDAGAIKGLTEVKRAKSKTVTAEGERTTNETLNALLPAAFMALILISVLTSGQYLLTSTVEEKSTRVVEVLLSALSPMELMTGKILGQMGVGLLVLILYAGLGVIALISFATVGLLDPMMIVFLFIFYLLAYFTIAALMAAIGSAVNEMREAQALMTPVMIFLMIPWMLWLPITREPNSALSLALSFIPPISNFVMLLRMTSAAPPPMWQAAVAIVIGMVGVYASIWFASKVFRVGLLAFGKPPDFKTLVKWARMA